ncbi:exopolyphosphatase PRUNE1 [Trichoplusia ni]|uniref:Exopolyphosphatase PRUNE1 n=1 Tax=Trichoplusia ni TaxID=7111 RepID=A0A7E5V895_TRINI|nr:exopolyphosphatase PRUNE1 [Trichoplusia ni]
MDDYFAAAITKLNSNFYGELNLVIGNESCDLDSAVSSIVYACFLNWQYNQIKCKVCTKIHRDESIPVKDDIFLPVLNVDRKDYDLKTEVAYFLREKGINENNLIFRDDHDIAQLLNKSKCKVVLVDHHVLAKQDKYLAPYVSEIIDHRPIDRTAWHYKDDTRSTIETVGSCCTLIAQRIKDLGTLVARDVDFFNAYPVCSEMLHATIILDTVNFSKAVDKATPHDEEITLFLESLLKPTDYKEMRTRVLDSLVAARSDVSRLSAAQLLRKDVKTVTDVLVPSFPILVKDFLARPGALQAVTEALSSQSCGIAVLLGMDLTKGLQRDAAVYSPKQSERASVLGKYLSEYNAPSLKLVPEVLAHASEFCYYRQDNLSASRKQYMPALNNFMNRQ